MLDCLLNLSAETNFSFCKKDRKKQKNLQSLTTIVGKQFPINTGKKKRIFRNFDLELF